MLAGTENVRPGIELYQISWLPLPCRRSSQPASRSNRDVGDGDRPSGGVMRQGHPFRDDPDRHLAHGGHAVGDEQLRYIE